MNSTQSVYELTHEIGSAVFRVAAVIRHNFLRSELERAAVDLVAYIDEEAIQRLRRLITLAASVSQMSEINSGVLTRELNNLESLMDIDDEEDDFNLEGLFGSKNVQLPFKNTLYGNNAEIALESEPSKRQKEILTFIGQFPNGCRMAEIANKFANVSRRTLRNDTAALISKNLVERVGGRGPYSFLRAVDPARVDMPQKETVPGDPGVIFLSSPNS